MSLINCRNISKSKSMVSHRRRRVRQFLIEQLEVRNLLAGEVIDLRPAFPDNVYEGDAGYFPVARFDSSVGSTPDDYLAKVDWQDGVQNLGLVRYDAGFFEVMVSRHFHESRTIPYTVKVFNTVEDLPETHELPTWAVIKSHSDSLVQSSLTGYGVNVYPDQGATITQSIAEFTDSQLGRPLSGYRATIEWPAGMGGIGASSSLGIVSQVAAGKFTVTPAATVWARTALSSTFKVNISFMNEQSIQVRSSLMVKSLPITNVINASMQQQQFGNVKTEYFEGLIAEFELDPQNAVASPNLWGLVQWGDGFQEVSLNNNTNFSITQTWSSSPTKQRFQVWGKHKYTWPGTFGVEVSIFESQPGKSDAPLARKKITNSVAMQKADFVEPREQPIRDYGGACVNSSGPEYDVNLAPFPIQIKPTTQFGVAGSSLNGTLGTITEGASYFTGGTIVQWGTPNSPYGVGSIGSSLSFANTYQRPGSYVIESHVNFHYQFEMGNSCQLDRYPVVQLFTPVEIEAPAVSITIPESLNDDTFISYQDVLSQISGARSWSMATIDWGDGKHLGVFEYGYNNTWNLVDGYASAGFDFIGNRFIQATVYSDTKTASSTLLVTHAIPGSSAPQPLKPIESYAASVAPVSSIKKIDVAKITDTNPQHIGGAHIASINWNLGANQDNLTQNTF